MSVSAVLASQNTKNRYLLIKHTPMYWKMSVDNGSPKYYIDKHCRYREIKDETQEMTTQ